tara:strand:+ start:289 stop:504 length:216 start_codon:yes stop_codon:yes gene_type:complete
MSDKGISDFENNMQSQSDITESEKPEKSRRVDINVLKSKLQETESKEFKKNIFILSILIFALVILGIYLSL